MKIRIPILKVKLDYYFSRDLYNWEEARQTALDTFQKVKSSYMHVAVQGLEIDMKLVKK